MRRMKLGNVRWKLTAASGAVLAAGGWLGLNRLVLCVSVLLQVVFVVFFGRHLAFTISAMRAAPGDLKRNDERDSDTAWPAVSILVACKNEEDVLDGLVGSLLAVDYPRDRVDIVIVNDASTDATGPMLDARAHSEPLLTVIHRQPGSTGGKPGALNAGLAAAHGEVVVVFDADHRPRPDAVRKLVRHFRDPVVAAVQGRCMIGNVDDSLLARLVWIDYLGGYLVNEYGRQSLFQLPAYGGANCAVRASSLRAAGGWNEHSVTEDTDLTLRLLLRGERVRYDVEAIDEEEGVVTLKRFWHQRYRWARGHQQVWRDYRRAVWSSPRFSLSEKAELTMFLLVFHLPVASAAGLIVFGSWVAGFTDPFSDTHVFVFWTLLFLGPLLELGGGLLIAGAPRRSATLLVYFIPVFFVSIALCTKAWIDAMRNRPYVWQKTQRHAFEPAGVAT